MTVKRELHRLTRMTRRRFLKTTAAGTVGAAVYARAGFLRNILADQADRSTVFMVGGIPENPYLQGGNYHAGVETLLRVFSACERKFYRSDATSDILSGPGGIIGPDDVVLLKVNAQWCYRGATNTDLLRGLIQRIIDHPDGFTGEIVLLENTQGEGGFDCDRYSDHRDFGTRANALDPSQSFNAVVSLFSSKTRISAYLLDGIRTISVGEDDHETDGYVSAGFVTYPKFTTVFGTRIDLKNGIWNGSSYEDRLRLINVPVLKDHGGAKVTSSLKHSYGLLSMRLMPQGADPLYHYSDLGTAAATMWSAVCPADMHLVDALYSVIRNGPGYDSYDEAVAPRTAALLASTDPVAVDYIAGKYVLFPASDRLCHHPDYPGIFRNYLIQAETKMRAEGCVSNASEGNIDVARGIRGALDLMGRKHRRGERTEQDVRHLLEYYYRGVWVS